MHIILLCVFKSTLNLNIFDSVIIIKEFNKNL